MLKWKQKGDVSKLYFLPENLLRDINMLKWKQKRGCVQTIFFEKI